MCMIIPQCRTEMTAFTNSYTLLSSNIFTVMIVDKYQQFGPSRSDWRKSGEEPPGWFNYWRTCHMKRSLKKEFEQYREEKTRKDLLKVSQYLKKSLVGGWRYSLHKGAWWKNKSQWVPAALGDILSGCWEKKKKS